MTRGSLPDRRRITLPRFIAKGWRHLHLLRGTAAASLNRSFSNDAIRAAMSGTLLYAGIPPDKIPAAALLSLAAMFRSACAQSRLQRCDVAREDEVAALVAAPPRARVHKGIIAALPHRGHP